MQSTVMNSKLSQKSSEILRAVCNVTCHSGILRQHAKSVIIIRANVFFVSFSSNSINFTCEFSEIRFRAMCSIQPSARIVPRRHTRR